MHTTASSHATDAIDANCQSLIERRSYQRETPSTTETHISQWLSALDIFRVTESYGHRSHAEKKPVSCAKVACVFGRRACSVGAEPYTFCFACQRQNSGDGSGKCNILVPRRHPVPIRSLNARGSGDGLRTSRSRPLACEQTKRFFGEESLRFSSLVFIHPSPLSPAPPSRGP